MKQILDLHIHSRFSRACSKQLTLPNIARWCERKGIDIVGTGDFTHPAWLQEIKEQLIPVEKGVFALKDGSSKTNFFLSTELSCIYKKGVRARRIHLCVFAPSISAVEKIVAALTERGCNLRSDGRPILGIDAKELLKIFLEIDPDILMVPAHAWTPWFAVFGSESGFDSLEECFDELAPAIVAIETGLSSDPPMNWQLSALDRVFLLSNSDAHSLPNLGREANVMDFDSVSYPEFVRILRERDHKRFLFTIEFFPEEGKYHFDGHRLCGVRLHPKETQKLGGICPQCKKPLTIGVLSRVEALADRPHGFKPQNAVPHRSLVPLAEIIAATLGRGVATKAVKTEYEKILEKGGNEFSILLDHPVSALRTMTTEEIAEGISRVREGALTILPGYDGEYGTVSVFSPEERGPRSKQQPLL
ncbi:MAG: endonuclease Q family protein [Patescibacteria group bacterium]